MDRWQFQKMNDITVEGAKCLGGNNHLGDTAAIQILAVPLLYVAMKKIK